MRDRQMVMALAQEWATGQFFDQETKQEIQQLLDQRAEDELFDRYYQDLTFGTGGLRGIIGAGTNRMNIYTVRRATQGVVNYLREQFPDQPLSISISYDNRRFSRLFAEEAGCVLAGNDIHVYIFSKLSPTPLLSYSVRKLRATGGIMVTASHNPPQYNGFKVYWKDGSQITSPHDRGITRCIASISDYGTIGYMDYETARKKGKIIDVQPHVERHYYRNIVDDLAGNPLLNRNLGLVYTPLHGTGNYPVRHLLSLAGFQRVAIVPEQEQPDSEFSTVKYPNPEEPEAFEKAVDVAKVWDQIILTSDPDADRMGVMVKHKEEWIRLNGNQIGQLMLYYYLQVLKRKNQLPENGYYISTIVTSELGKKIAKSFGLKHRETLTGFKYIAEEIRKLEAAEEGKFIFGCEESHGYLIGDFVRDKDGVSACLVIAQMAAELMVERKTLIDALEEIHQQYGYYLDSLMTRTYIGVTGVKAMNSIMNRLRETPPETFAEGKVTLIKDYQDSSERISGGSKNTHASNLPQSDVLAFYLEDGSRITVRPSGTEPKIKCYLNLYGTEKKSLEAKQKQYEEALLQILQ